MLTPEQTAIRQLDAEITRLRKSKEALESKMLEVKVAFIDLAKYIAKDMTGTNKTQLLDAVKELEDSLEIKGDL